MELEAVKLCIEDFRAGIKISRARQEYATSLWYVLSKAKCPSDLLFQRVRKYKDLDKGLPYDIIARLDSLQSYQSAVAYVKSNSVKITSAKSAPSLIIPRIKLMQNKVNVVHNSINAYSSDMVISDTSSTFDIVLAYYWAQHYICVEKEKKFEFVWDANVQAGTDTRLVVMSDKFEDFFENSAVTFEALERQAADRARHGDAWWTSMRPWLMQITNGVKGLDENIDELQKMATKATQVAQKKRSEIQKTFGDDFFDMIAKDMTLLEIDTVD